MLSHGSYSGRLLFPLFNLMRIVLTHIPRTGGSSLFAGMRSQMPAARAIEFDSYAEVAMITDNELNRYDLISTYLGSKFIDRLKGDWIKILVLRDPLARLRSSYWHLRTTAENFSFASLKAKECNFRDYLAARDPAVIFQATNTQTWTVLGDKSVHFRQQWRHRNEDDIVEQASAALARYDFVGFTDSLDIFWAELGRKLNWRTIPLARLRANSPIKIEEEATPEDLRYHTALDERLISVARVQNKG